MDPNAPPQAVSSLPPGNERQLSPGPPQAQSQSQQYQQQHQGGQQQDEGDTDSEESSDENVVQQLLAVMNLEQNQGTMAALTPDKAEQITVPLAKLRPTKGLARQIEQIQKYQGRRRKKVPTICRDYSAGSCKYDRQCCYLHLRAEPDNFQGSSIHRNVLIPSIKDSPYNRLEAGQMVVLQETRCEEFHYFDSGLLFRTEGAARCVNNLQRPPHQQHVAVQHCTHYLKGFCERGETCKFVHCVFVSGVKYPECLRAMTRAGASRGKGQMMILKQRGQREEDAVLAPVEVLAGVRPPSICPPDVVAEFVRKSAEVASRRQSEASRRGKQEPQPSSTHGANPYATSQPAPPQFVAMAPQPMYQPQAGFAQPAYYLPYLPGGNTPIYGIMAQPGGQQPNFIPMNSLLPAPPPQGGAPLQGQPQLPLQGSPPQQFYPVYFNQPPPGPQQR